MRSTSVRAPAVSRFFLYGEPARPVESRFVHLENLEDRSAPSWTIRPHVHADLHHVFHITEGGGELTADAERLTYAAPCIMVIPARVVHSMVQLPRSKGAVLTFADSYLCSLASQDSALQSIYAGCAWIGAVEDKEFAVGLQRLERELGWAAPGHTAAVDALLTTLLIEVLRSFHHIASEARRPGGSQQARLVARFRQLVEGHYRETRDIETYARRLGVTSSRLRAACQGVAGRAPSQLLYDRLALEARRIMHYSDMSISEIAYYLGFDDPAYFSRFCSKTLGMSPRRFRSGTKRILLTHSSGSL